ncbi:MAG TPA: MOSC domain-containing protein [Marmoricola sp.]|nr:MOSC domain-containing protein [Marmoricola sp.]
MGSVVGRVVTLSRYPVKSMAGEHPDRLDVDGRGVVGDRVWAAYTADGGIGSGKTTRRFRRVEGLLDLRARLDGGTPLVLFPDGRERRAGEPATDEALSDLLGRPMRLQREGAVPHHDDAPLHLVTTAALRRLEELTGIAAPAARFRANLELDVAGSAFVEDGWADRRMRIGEDLVVRLGRGMPRCVMADMAQPHEGLAHDGRVLKAVADVHDLDLGLMVSVERPGAVRVGDEAVLL